MPARKPAAPRPTRFYNEPTATIYASVIGGVCALAAAVLPMMLGDRSTGDAAPSAPSTNNVVAAPGTALSTPIATPVRPNLTLGTFTFVESRDDLGNDWRNSVLKFTSQETTTDGLRLEGFFEWRENGRYVGREHVTAAYVDGDRHVYLEGRRIEAEPDSRLGVGSFSAVLSADGRRLTDGTWGTLPGQLDGVPGTWEARR